MSGKINNASVNICSFHQAVKIPMNNQGVHYIDFEPILKPPQRKTTMFTSLNLLLSELPNRKDDLESLGYILMYLFERNI